MKRTPLFMLVLAWSLAVPSAMAARNEPPMHDPTPFPRIDAVIDSTYRGRMEVVDVQFVGGFSPGGSRDIDAGELQRAADLVRQAGRERDRDIVFIGATDPMRFHATRAKLTNLHNYTLALARANYIKQRTGLRGMVSTDVLLNDRRGVYVVTIQRRDRDDVVAIGGDIPDSWDDEMAGREIVFNPHVAVAYVRAGGTDYTAPQVGIGIRKGNYALFTSYGRTFRDPDDNRVQTAGLRIGDDDGVFGQLMFIDARKLVPYFDQYVHRAVGGTAGLGVGWHPAPLDVVLNGGIGAFDVVSPDALKNRWEFGFNLGFGIGFTY